MGVRRWKCIFLGYSNTSKDYRMYDEVNKKFIVSRDVIFLESSKDDKTVERQFDNLDKFTHQKTYYECNNEIPHLEGGIPILDQSLESPFAAPSPPHEQVAATSSEKQGQLDNVIEGIKRLSLEDQNTIGSTMNHQQIHVYISLLFQLMKSIQIVKLSLGL
jgi:hypothetical protein